MANNYCESSSMFYLEKNQVEEARKILKTVCMELENDPKKGYIGFETSFEPEGLWIHNFEIDVEHVAILAERLVDELKIDKPFVFSWAYTCSSPRIDEFGGGACCVKRGEKTFWVDALSVATDHFTRQD
jgi:hypothetical protein